MTETMGPDHMARWHFWLVVLIAVLWNGFGGYDYVMSNTAGEAYFRQMGMTDTQIAYFTALPSWMIGVWAIGVWGSVAATVLLIFRSRWAFHTFVAALATLLISLIYTHDLSNGGEVMGTEGMVMNAIILAASLFFVWYARLMVKQGILG